MLRERDEGGWKEGSVSSVRTGGCLKINLQRSSNRGFKKKRG